MSAFGTVAEFFQGDGAFSNGAFVAWLENDVLAPGQSFLRDIAAWLPNELELERNGMQVRDSLARAAAENLRDRLCDLHCRFTTGGASEDKDSQGEWGTEGEEASSLLDLLFDTGILPSYAFPTSLCSLVIQELADNYKIRVKERPQLAKAQALSEYAPGRLVVLNKETYRVGGIFVDGPPTSAPALGLFAASMTRYVGCRCCTYIRLDKPGALRMEENALCPVCGGELLKNDLLDPPAFSPENGRALREGDRDQEVTYATAAQLPELAEKDSFEMQEGVGINLGYGYGEDVLLVVTNKGKDGTGFCVCERCGAAGPAGEEAPAVKHRRPFLLPKSVLEREGTSYLCDGPIREGIYLGHEFRTDVLLLRIPLRRPLDAIPTQLWLHDALATLSEATALGASRHLDIDPGELSAGFRFRSGNENATTVAEIFLYDTSSGGAGYAAEAGANLSAVLGMTEKLLAECSKNCQRSCDQCLRHYGNRFLHTRLDRRLARDLLRYALTGAAPAINDKTDQAATLAPLAQYLRLEGWTIHSPGASPLKVEDPSGKRVLLGTYPALLAREDAELAHSLTSQASDATVLLPDYLIEQDLPSAYQALVGALKGNTPILPGSRDAPSMDSRLWAEFPVKTWNDPLPEASPDASRVRLRVTTAASGCFAIRVPSAALASADLPAGTWLIVRPIGGGNPENGKLVLLLHKQGTFRATNEPWTVAMVRKINNEGIIQVSYGRGEVKFRPERISDAVVTMVGTVVATVSGE
jgi:hypothetical protein